LSARQLAIKAALAGLVAVVAGSGYVHESAGMAGAQLPVAATLALPVVGDLLFNQPAGAIRAIRLPSLEAIVMENRGQNPVF
jgi:hypothetical protein